MMRAVVVCGVRGSEHECESKRENERVSERVSVCLCAGQRESKAP